MVITVEAVYENGVLKLAQPLPLTEHEKVQVTVHVVPLGPRPAVGVIPCADPQLIEWAAMDAELDYPPPHVPALPLPRYNDPKQPLP